MLQQWLYQPQLQEMQKALGLASEKLINLVTNATNRIGRIKVNGNSIRLPPLQPCVAFKGLPSWETR